MALVAGCVLPVLPESVPEAKYRFQVVAEAWLILIELAPAYPSPILPPVGMPKPIVLVAD